MIPGGGAWPRRFLYSSLQLRVGLVVLFAALLILLFALLLFHAISSPPKVFGNIVAGMTKNIRSLRHSERNEEEPKVLAGVCLEILHCFQDDRTGKQADGAGGTKNHISGRKGLPDQSAYATMENQRIVRIFYYLS